jgi:D-inositol-3-phosphate glycosyltransferase
MRPDSLVTRLARLQQRTTVHARRAATALKRAGPGRFPGSIDFVHLHGAGIELIGRLADVVEPPVALVVMVNGRAVGMATMHTDLTEDDVMPPEFGTGPKVPYWRALLPGDHVPDGDLLLEVLAIGDSGLVEQLEPSHLPAEARDRPRRLQGLVDAPAEGLLARGGVLEINGWVLDPRDLDRIEVTLDGDRVERARLLAFERHDLGGRIGHPSNVLCAFAHSLDLTDLAQGSRHELAVEAVGPAGRTVLGQRHFEVGPVSRPLDADDRAAVPVLESRAALAAGACVPAAGLNLLVVTHDLDRGGAQLWMHQILLRVLADWDVTCTVISPEDGDLRAELEAVGARVHIAGPYPSTFAPYESKVHDIIGRAVQDGTNVVFANTVGSYIGIDVALRCGLPSVFAIHEHFPTTIRLQNTCGWDQMDEHVRSRADAALAQASAVGFVADATRQLYFPDGNAERAVTVSYGVALDEVDQTRQRLDRQQLRLAHGYRPDDQVLVCVATVNGRKAQANLVMAFSRLAGERPDLHLVLVGHGDTPYAASVRRLADTLGLGHRVRMIPFTDEVAPWWVMADGFVLGSDAESLPRSIIEAMAYEVPVAATDVGGVRELVVDGQTGILIPHSDIGELARAMRRLVDTEPALLSAMTARGAALVRTSHDGTGYVEAYGRLLRGLAKDPGAAPASLLAGE